MGEEASYAVESLLKDLEKASRPVQVGDFHPLGFFFFNGISMGMLVLPVSRHYSYGVLRWPGISLES